MPNRCLNSDEQDQISDNMLKQGFTFQDITTTIENKNFELGCPTEIDRRKKKTDIHDEQDLQTVDSYLTELNRIR